MPSNNCATLRPIAKRKRHTWCFPICFFVFLTAASAQISPGPLSRSHQSLSGATNCSSCHKFGGQAKLKCLECHAEIADRLLAAVAQSTDALPAIDAEVFRELNYYPDLRADRCP